MDYECLNIIVGITLGIIQIGLTIVIFRLSNRLSFKSKLENRDLIKPKLDSIINEIFIQQKRRHSVVLVDVDVYDKYYPSNENPFGRYSHFKAEIKNTIFNGVEFFWGTSKVYFNKDNETYTFRKQKDGVQTTVFCIGVIPYEWIVDIDLKGDEYNGTLLYCKFNNKSKWKIKSRFIQKKINRNKYKQKKMYGLEQHRDPFRKCIYYIENSWYEEGKTHFDLKYSQIEVK